MSRHMETVIVGGGQAGLAVSYYLRQRNRPHLVLARLLSTEGRVDGARQERDLALAFAGEQRHVITSALNQR